MPAEKPVITVPGKVAANRLQPAEGAWTTLAPSALPFKEGDPIPRAVSRSEIDGIISCPGEAAAERAEAGFQIIEDSAAHGYF